MGEMNARELRSCLIVVMVSMLVTVHIQLYAMFYVSSDTSDTEYEINGCYRNVQVALTRNMTSNDMLAEWKSLAADSGGYLLAVPRNRQNYMAMGCVLSSNTTTITLDVLSQLVNHTSLYHKLHTVIVIVILNNVDRHIAQQFVETIVAKYLYELSIGFIHVIQQGRSDWWSGSDLSIQQVKAMSLMSDYVASISRYYLHLGSSDIIIPVDYIDDVKDFVQRETRRRQRITTWTLLQFSTTDDDFVGCFLHAADVHRFASFHLMFDGANTTRNRTLTLHSMFLDIVTQRATLLRRPSLFKRRNNPDDLLEDDVAKPWPTADDPSATVLSSMLPVGSHTVDLVYASGAGYFQSSSVKARDWIAVVFEAEVNIERIMVRTGLPDGSHTLKSGFIELSPRLLKMDTTVPDVVCADFVRVGDIVRKSTELNNVGKLVWGRPTRCLRVTVGENNSHEVVFHQIAVFSK